MQRPQSNIRLRETAQVGGFYLVPSLGRWGNFTGEWEEELWEAKQLRTWGEQSCQNQLNRVHGGSQKLKWLLRILHRYAFWSSTYKLWLFAWCFRGLLRVGEGVTLFLNFSPALGTLLLLNRLFHQLWCEGLCHSLLYLVYVRLMSLRDLFYSREGSGSGLEGTKVYTWRGRGTGRLSWNILYERVIIKYKESGTRQVCWIFLYNFNI